MKWSYDAIRERLAHEADAQYAEQCTETVLKALDSVIGQYWTSCSLKKKGAGLLAEWFQNVSVRDRLEGVPSVVKDAYIKTFDSDPDSRKAKGIRKYAEDCERVGYTPTHCHEVVKQIKSLDETAATLTSGHKGPVRKRSFGALTRFLPGGTATSSKAPKPKAVQAGTRRSSAERRSSGSRPTPTTGSGSAFMGIRTFDFEHPDKSHPDAARYIPKKK